MNITKLQRITLVQLWNKVCKDRGWSASDRTLRLATMGELLGRAIESMDDIGRTDECTKVMNGLKAMLGVSVKAGLELAEPERNQARILKHKIMNELLPCLALYVEDVPAYVTGIMEDKNRWWKIDRPACEITLEDLDSKPIFRFVKGERKEFPSTLEQLMMTLAARLNSKRNEAGQTIHEMKLAAGVFCDCSPCSKARAALANGGAAALAEIPPLPAGVDESKTTAEIIAGEDPDWTV